jgi:hypothetical protein
MSEWVGVIQSTAPLYMKGAEDLTMRNRLILAMIQRKGRIKLNQSSHLNYWDVEFAQPPIESRADGGVLNFSRNDLLRQLSNNWRGYYGTDMMTRKEMLMNKGPSAIVKRYDRIMPALTKSLRNRFSGELFINGDAAGNENRLHGLESFMGAGTCVAADRVAVPDGSYGGFSTDLASQGGSWSANLTTKPNSTIATDWPDGQGDSEYDWLAPKLINYTSSSWIDNSNKTWALTCELVMTQAQIWLTHTGGMDAAPDLALLSSDLFYQYKNKISAMRRIIVPHKEASDLGFGNVLNHEGMALQEDFDCPAATGYVMNLDQMELASIAPELFWTEGPNYDARTDAWLFLVGFFGNCRYKPKYFGKLYPYAT